MEMTPLFIFYTLIPFFDIIQSSTFDSYFKQDLVFTIHKALALLSLARIKFRDHPEEATYPAFLGERQHAFARAHLGFLGAGFEIFREGNSSRKVPFNLGCLTFHHRHDNPQKPRLQSSTDGLSNLPFSRRVADATENGQKYTILGSQSI